jgi:hypothetical protein
MSVKPFGRGARQSIPNSAMRTAITPVSWIKKGVFIKTKNMNEVESFIHHVKSECRRSGVLFKPYKRSYIKLTDNIKCAGFFDDGSDPKIKKATLAFAQGRPDYLELLVHEYCHMTQWEEQIPLWTAAIDGLTVVDDWLSGVDYPDDVVENSINVSRDLELDNEKRSVAMMKKWELPIDTDLYTKKSNAYVLFYNWMKESRKWSSPKNPPYNNPVILAAMSELFDMDYVKLTPELVEIYKNNT